MELFNKNDDFFELFFKYNLKYEFQSPQKKFWKRVHL